MPLLLITAPSNSGPGERKQMLDAAAEFFAANGVERSDIVRIDVPGRGAGEPGDGTLRAELEPMVPLLQSGSLFGGDTGLELVDAENLQSGEASILDGLVRGADLTRVHVVLAVAGTPVKAIADLTKELGSRVSVQKMWERQAGEWLSSEIESRGLTIDKPAREALLQRFGTDTAAIGQALDQLTEHGGEDHPGAGARLVPQSPGRARLAHNGRHLERGHW